MITITKATLLMRRRVTGPDGSFAEYVVWELPKPALPSSHSFKYRLAYVENGQCVVRYDNEAGKGDYRHFGVMEFSYEFSSPRQLISDFEDDMERWKYENRHS